jgi:hypothetical protein
VLGAAHEVVLGIEEERLAPVGLSEDALDYQAHAKSDTGQHSASEPSHDEFPRAIDDRGLDVARTLPRVDPDVLNDPRRDLVLASLEVPYRDRVRYRRRPMSEPLGARFFRRLSELLPSSLESGHEGEVWQYRRFDLRR